jgi:hypothetical protein
MLPIMLLLTNYIAPRQEASQAHVRDVGRIGVPMGPASS